MNKYDTYMWVCKNIDSCINRKQLITCRRLLQNFNELYNDSNLYLHIEGYIRSKENRLIKIY
jgi:hypothetical protein